MARPGPLSAPTLILATATLTGLLASNDCRAAAIAWTGAGPNKFWETAGNWNLNRAPQNTDDVTIPGGKGDITTDGTSIQKQNNLPIFAIAVTSLTIQASPADAGATRIVGSDAGVGVSITTSADITIGTKSGVIGRDGKKDRGKNQFGGNVTLVSTNGNVSNSGNVIAGTSVQTKPSLAGGAVSISAMTIVNGGLLQSGDAGANNQEQGSTWHGADGGDVTLTASKEASPAITSGGIIRTGKGGTGGGVLKSFDPPINMTFRAGAGGGVIFKATAKSTVLHTGTIITGDGGPNSSNEAGQRGGPGGDVICYDATFVPNLLPLPLQAAPVIQFGKGAAGTQNNPANHPEGRAGKLLSRQLAVKKPAGGLPLLTAALSDSFYTCSYAFVGGTVALSDPEGTAPSVDLSNLNATAIMSDSSVVFDLCSTCTVDLRGNDGSVKIIRAGQSICIFGNVLTDPGVSVADLTDPPALVSSGSLPCPLPAAADPVDVVQAFPAADNHIYVAFSTPITPASAQTTSNYTLGAPGTISSATLIQPELVDLTVSMGLHHGDPDSLMVNNIVSANMGITMTGPESWTFFDGVLSCAETQAPDPVALGAPGDCVDRSIYAGPDSSLGNQTSVHGRAIAQFDSLYYIGDPGNPTRGGLAVVAPPGIMVSDHNYLVVGQVQEFEGETQLSSIAYLEDDGVVSGPYAASTKPIATLRDASCDPTLSVDDGNDSQGRLVTASYGKIIGSGNAGTSFTIFDPTVGTQDSVQIDAALSGQLTFVPIAGHVVTVTGIEHLDRGAYTVCPRSDSDVLDHGLNVSVPSTVRREVTFDLSPNPAKSAKATFALPEPGEVRLTVYDVSGRVVTTLANGHFSAGSFSRTWDGLDSSGGSVGAGMFFLRLVVDGKPRTLRAVHLE